jgi:hypothetical protein
METWNSFITFLTGTTPIHNWIGITALVVELAVLIFLWIVARKNGKLKTQLWDWEEYYIDSQNEVTKLKADNALMDDYKDQYEKLCSATEDRIKIAENRTACAEGKLKKINTRMVAMNIMSKLCYAKSEDWDSKAFREAFETIHDCLTGK